MVHDDMLQRFFAGESTPQENSLIQAWLESDPGNEAAFQAAHRRFAAGILALEPARTEGRRRPARIHRRIWAYAATAAAALVLGLFLGRTPRAESAAPTELSIHAPFGQRTRLTLADGTSVELNSGATLTFPTVFEGRERRVRLDGEAMFDVVHDADCPFMVETFLLDIVDVGTRFDVIAEEADGRFETALLEGSIQLLDRKGRAIADMKPGTVVRQEDGRLVLGQVADSGVYRWTEGIISLGGLSSDEMLRRLERSYGVHIVVDREVLPEFGFSSLRLRVSEGIDHALDVLRMASDFRWTYDEKTDTYHIL